MGIVCCGPDVSCSINLPPLTLSSPVILDTQSPWRFVEYWSSPENSPREGDSLSVSKRTTTTDLNPDETSSHEGVQLATSSSSTNTSTLSSEYSEDNMNEYNSAWSHTLAKSEQDNEDKIDNTLINVATPAVHTVHKESKMSKINNANNYTANLTWSKSVLVVVEPDDDYDDLQFSDIVIVGDTDAIIEKLKTENVDKEKMIQELLMQNKKLKKSFHDGRRHVKRRSIKLQEKINDIRERSSLPVGIPSLRTERWYRKSRIDNPTKLPNIIDQRMLFSSSLHEAKDRRKRNRELPESRDKSKSGTWQYSEFTLL